MSPWISRYRLSRVQKDAESAAERDEQDEELATRLVEAWLGSLEDDEDGEATAEMIDLLEQLPADDEPYDNDPRLRSLFGLIGCLSGMLERYYETTEEHQLVLDAFTDAMRLLASQLERRAHQGEEQLPFTAPD
jgi:hypothetical protein